MEGTIEADGVVLSSIFLIYTMTSIASVFFITAGTFAVAADEGKGKNQCLCQRR